MIKYIASDLDGTLLQGGAQSLNPEIFDLILQLKKRNIHFIAASGRPYRSLRHLFEPVKDDISYVAENGSLCIHNNQIVSRGLIERDLGLRIINAAKEFPDYHLLLSCESSIYTDSHNAEFFDHLRSVLKFDVTEVDDLQTITEPFLKFAICDFNGTAELESQFCKRFSSEIKIVTSGNIWIDFIAPNANKATGIEAIAKLLGFSAKDGIAFGDQFNDIEMLKSAGTSYAMSTCAPGVEKYADFQTDSVEKILREIILGTK